ncbi:MAG: hypothetical protein HZB33_09290 [Nitrospirae bacterium]|nr:hypothetical protein [Nitrospirota bacterium]
MLFAKQIDPNSKIKNVAIAFKLDFLESSGAKKVTLFEDGVSIAKQMKVIQIDGQLSVFFPAEKETTKLQFHIHGPFASTIARDSIPYNSDNKKLINEVGTLLAESLYSIKELGLLTVDLLAALPNDIDCLSDFYKPLQIAVVKEMKANPLVPTHLRSHASAAQLYQGPSAIREVISDEDLKFLIHWNGNIQWAVGVMQNSRPERFMRSLGITEWSWENLIDVMWANFRLHNSGNEQWIHSKSDDWLQRFYILLKKASDEQGSWKLEDCRIVRLQSGEYGRGNEAFFPAEDEKKSKKNNELFPKVKLDLLKGSRKAKVREFLESIGVKDVGKEEELKSILNTYYPSYDTVEAISHNKHITHMKKFVLHWNTQKSANLFSGFRIFFDHTGQILRPPAELYLDLPYNETGLEAYFDAARKLEIRKHKLWDGYKNQSIKHFEEFTKCLGIMDGLEIREHKATATQSHIFSGRSGKINRDYYINGLGWYNKGSSSYFGMFSLSADSICLSRLIWKLMSNTTTDALRAVYKTSHTEKNAPSLIVNQLREAKWIPDKDGKFRRPAEMAKATLHKDFPYDDRNGWLTTIGFGDAEKKKTEEYKTLKELCTKRGLSEDVAELLSEMAGLPREEQKERIKNFRKQLQEAKLKSSFPEKESPNPERRSKKVAENLPDAPEKSYEIRERSVRVSNGEAKIAAKEYLQDCYTNPDGEMVCQICEDVMPFKLDDGSFYFETVELLRDFPKECAEKYLALCPVCSAKFQYALGTKPEALSSAILNTDSLTSPLLLARENKTIRFVKVHLEDIRTLLQNVER